MAAFAAFSLGGQIVPMYEAQLEKDWKYILEDSDASVLLVANDSIYKKTSAWVNKVFLDDAYATGVVVRSLTLIIYCSGG